MVMRMATTSSENSWEEERDGEGEEGEGEAKGPGGEKENSVSLYRLACVANSATTKRLPHVNTT